MNSDRAIIQDMIERLAKERNEAMLDNKKFMFRALGRGEAEYWGQLIAKQFPWNSLGYDKDVLARFLARYAESAVVLECGGEPISISVVKPDWFFGDLISLFIVMPPFQGKGFGRAMLEYVERRNFSKHRNMWITTTNINKNAIKFYKKHGYKEIGYIPDLLVKGSVEILVRKTEGPVLTVKRDMED